MSESYSNSPTNDTHSLTHWLHGPQSVVKSEGGANLSFFGSKDVNSQVAYKLSLHRLVEITLIFAF